MSHTGVMCIRRGGGGGGSYVTYRCNVHQEGGGVLYSYHITPGGMWYISLQLC